MKWQSEINTVSVNSFQWNRKITLTLSKSIEIFRFPWKILSKTIFISLCYFIYQTQHFAQSWPYPQKYQRPCILFSECSTFRIRNTKSLFYNKINKQINKLPSDGEIENTISNPQSWGFSWIIAYAPNFFDTGCCENY